MSFEDRLERARIQGEIERANKRAESNGIALFWVFWVFIVYFMGQFIPAI